MNRKRTIWLTVVFGLLLLTAGLLPTAHAASPASEAAQALKARYEALYRKLAETMASDPTDRALPALRDEVQKAKAAWQEALKGLQNLKVEIKVERPPQEAAAAAGPAASSVAGAGATTTVSLPGFKKPEPIDGNNYCGQYAMTSVLQYFGAHVIAQEVYQATNPGGIFTAPPTIVEYLNSQGVQARLRQNASLRELKARLDARLPVIVLVDCGGTPHWVCVSGYTADPNGNIVSLELRDSYWAINQPSGTYTMPVATFQSIWRQPCTGRLGQFVGYSNLMVDIAGANAAVTAVPIYSGTFSTALEDSVAGAINDVYTGWKHMDFFSMGGGLVKGIGAIPAAAIALGGRGLSYLGDRLALWGDRTAAEGGAGNQVLGGLGKLGGTVLRAAGQVGSAAANLLASAGTLLGNGLKKLGSVFR
ncbi:MAG: hypothetical protein OZSIB_3345 [Candidatus Ozemobacter sibiricus]|uniref:Peptidase C39-like domain-containing protein n=1 Tax=Candidatus Ozemobacter sibiricus TaxID=2268124 RepID=A0A367ZD31_9BACT|nr:MAG: hypothetical protein OZSIB_3345 [Candidatus Ozemobacter sibiricus]